MPCYSPIKVWKNENHQPLFKAEAGAYEGEVSCRQCLGCRLDNSRMWATRIIFEASLHESVGGNCFVTLTYRDKSECTPKQLAKGQHIPDDRSLNKQHFTKFMKRLRKYLADHFDPRLRKIRYFQAGEYGTHCLHGIDLNIHRCAYDCILGRPHHHACLFNYEPHDLEVIGEINGVKQFTSPTLERLWSYGFVHIGECNPSSADYVARYILKKVNGPMADWHYQQITMDGELVYLEPEYKTYSPNLGDAWFEKYKSDFFPSDELPIPGGGIHNKVPDCYTKLLKESDPFVHEEILAKRVEYREANASDFTPQRLMDKYKVKKASLAMKKGKTVQ